MNTATKQMQTWEQHYQDVIELYVLADQLVATAAHSQVEDPETQLDVVGMLAETIGSSADILSEEFIVLCEGKPSRKRASKKRVEDALRHAYAALGEYALAARGLSSKARGITDSIVKKIKRQLELVITAFVDFITLSLDRIMPKHDVEELKQRQAKIALMLHQMSLEPRA
ncbi:MAG: hypothetical protein ACK5WQ_04780 [Alphaproteobacteria bacterium]|jgi:hypothetical protein